MSRSCEVKQKPKSVSAFLKSRLLWSNMLAIAIGAVGGILFYYMGGCQDGGCLFTSNPLSSLAFGGFVGLFWKNRPCGC